MQTEILDYTFSTDWDIKAVCSNEQFTNNLQPDFPFIATTISSMGSNSEERAWTDYLNGKKRGRPSDILDCFPGNLPRQAGFYLGLSSDSILINASCASTLYAFHTATLYSLHYKKPAVVFCAENYNHNFDTWKFSSLGALDNNTGRPFDKTSNGFKMGRSINLFLIKHPSVKFNMPSKATIINYGFYTNNQLSTNPGTYQDILTHIPNINYNKIDFWNAHATGTPIGDAVEYALFNAVIKKDAPIVSYKSHIGHNLTSSGAIEIAMSLDGKKNNVLLPNIIHGDKISNDDRIITEPTSFNYKHMLKASFGFGGKSAIAEIDLY